VVADMKWVEQHLNLSDDEKEESHPLSENETSFSSSGQEKSQRQAEEEELTEMSGSSQLAAFITSITYLLID